MLRYISAGESHGIGLIGIIEGIPSNLSINTDTINKELTRRQMGYGRGGRMKIEKDRAEIISGVRRGKTIGSPLSMVIWNKDWDNWKSIMNIEATSSDLTNDVTKPRPGHGDLPGAIKYNQRDIRNILERASARETAMRVAIGSIAKGLLREFGVEVFSHVLEIGDISTTVCKYEIDELRYADNSVVRVLDCDLEKRIIEKIDKAKEAGDTLGGIFEIVAINLPIGLGSHVSWDRKLDGKIAQGIMSLQGIKGVEIGLGFEASRRLGSEVHDEIFYDQGYYRTTNNAGGIEAGISNGNNIVVRAAMKPIPTLMKPLNSVDMLSKESFKAQKERSDVCAVPSASIVAESIVAWAIAQEFVLKFSGDSLEEMKDNYTRYIEYVNSR